MCESRHIKFSTLIYHSKSHPADEKSSPERGVVRPVLEFYTLYTSCNISATANAGDFKLCTRVGHVKSEFCDE